MQYGINYIINSLAMGFPQIRELLLSILSIGHVCTREYTGWDGDCSQAGNEWGIIMRKNKTTKMQQPAEQKDNTNMSIKGTQDWELNILQR